MMHDDYSSSDDSDVDDRAYRIVEGTQEKQKEKDARSAGHSTATPGARSSSSSKGHSASEDKKRRSDTAPGAQAGSSFMDKRRQSKELRNSSKSNKKKESQNDSRSKHGGGSKNGSRSRNGSNDGNRRHRSRGNDRSPHRRGRNNSSNNNTVGTAQPGAAANTSGTVELEAQVVRENSEENMNIALQQENERLRQQLDVTTAAATVAHAEPKESDSEDNNARICSKKTVMIIVFVLALIGAGIGAFFATQGATSSSSSSSSSSAVQDVAPITSPPTAPTAPTVSDTAAPVTSPPTEDTVVLKFDPPSAADCEAVFNGDVVAGQKDMDTTTYGIVLVVLLPVDTSLNIIVDSLVIKTQDIVIPDLVGCVEDRRRRRLEDNEYRFAIANAMVTGDIAVDSEGCDNFASQICYAIALEMDLAIKSSEIPPFKIWGLITEMFTSDLALVDRLDLGGSFRSIEVISITRTTLAPSPKPTMPPVDSPTLAPVTSSPTRSQATPTSNSPTKNPTKRPTPLPTVLEDEDEDCEENCTGSQSCDGHQNTVEVACGACIGTDSCRDLNEALIGDVACIGDYSCSYLDDVNISDESCIGDYSCACLQAGASVPFGGCTSTGDCCTSTGGPLGVPRTSCLGEETCQFASGPIGSNSCTGASRTCWKSKASIGDNSCNRGYVFDGVKKFRELLFDGNLTIADCYVGNKSGCEGLLGEVENETCNGSNACPSGREVLISQGSCNCDGCCACLTETFVDFDAVFVPPRSCLELAPSPELIDYDIAKLRDGKIQYCCSA